MPKDLEPRTNYIPPITANDGSFDFKPALVREKDGRVIPNRITESMRTAIVVDAVSAGLGESRSLRRGQNKRIKI